MYQEFQPGWIEVIYGPMFAGKSEGLIRRVRTLSFSNKNIIAFKPAIDDRYSIDEIASHAGERYKAYAINKAQDILKYIKEDTNIVAIDEVQFFDKSIIEIIEDMANKGIRVIVAGLDKDFRGEPFGIMPELLARAEFVTKLSACCKVCGQGATRTQRIINGKPAYYEDPIILVGANESYEARCRKHHEVPHKSK